MPHDRFSLYTPNVPAESLPDLLLRDQTEPPWLVQGMLAQGTMVTLAGEPGVGKSFLSYYLAYCVATGAHFLSLPTTPQNVCYFDEENSRPDFIKYNQRVWHGLGAPSLDLLTPRLHLYHQTLVDKWQPRMLAAAKDHAPGLIVIDTATPALHIQDENDNAEASLAIQNLRAVQRAAGPHCTVLILKHERQRDPSQHRRTIRGAKVWLGAVDQTFYHAIPRGGRRRSDGLRRTILEPDKMRSFGLDSALLIDPAWTDPSRKGLTLHGKLVPAESESDES